MASMMMTEPDTNTNGTRAKKRSSQTTMTTMTTETNNSHFNNNYHSHNKRFHSESQTNTTTTTTTTTTHVSKFELITMMRVIHRWKDATLQYRKKKQRCHCHDQQQHALATNTNDTTNKNKVQFHPPQSNIRRLGYDSCDDDDNDDDGSNSEKDNNNVDDDDDNDKEDMFHTVRVEQVEFDPNEAPRCLREATWETVSLSSNDVPWYEEEYEDLPWWEYPDLEQDDEITVLVKDVVSRSESKSSATTSSSSSRYQSHHHSNTSGKQSLSFLKNDNNNNEESQNWQHYHHQQQQQEADRVEAIVIAFCLKLKNRAAFTKSQREYQQQQQEQQQQEDEKEETKPNAVAVQSMKGDTTETLISAKETNSHVHATTDAQRISNKEELEASSTALNKCKPQPVRRRPSRTKSALSRIKKVQTQEEYEQEQKELQSSAPLPPAQQQPSSVQIQSESESELLPEKESAAVVPTTPSEEKGQEEAEVLENHVPSSQEPTLHGRLDQQQQQQQLLLSSFPTLAANKTSPVVVSKITKEDVAQMPTLDLNFENRKQKIRKQQQQQQQQHRRSSNNSVLDDDNVSLHSAVLSTGWNYLNIHNSELRRYQKNHHSYRQERRRKGGSYNNNNNNNKKQKNHRGLWADDHTVMGAGVYTRSDNNNTMMRGGTKTSGNTSVTGDDHDDGKSVGSFASFQSSPAMMEYTKTKQLLFSHHHSGRISGNKRQNNKFKEPKMYHRLTTSATFVPDEAPPIPLEEAEGGKVKKKKKKKKKKGQGSLALFMAKEELRSDHDEGAIFDIMEEIPETSNHGGKATTSLGPSEHSNNNDSGTNLDGSFLSKSQHDEIMVSARDFHDSDELNQHDSFHSAVEDMNNDVFQDSHGSMDMFSNDTDVLTHANDNDSGQNYNVMHESQGSMDIAGSDTKVLAHANDNGSRNNNITMHESQQSMKMIGSDSSNLVPMDGSSSNNLMHESEHSMNMIGSDSGNLVPMDGSSGSNNVAGDDQIQDNDDAVDGNSSHQGIGVDVPSVGDSSTNVLRNDDGSKRRLQPSDGSGTVLQDDTDAAFENHSRMHGSFMSVSGRRDSEMNEDTSYQTFASSGRSVPEASSGQNTAIDGDSVYYNVEADDVRGSLVLNQDVLMFVPTGPAEKRSWQWTSIQKHFVKPRLKLVKIVFIETEGPAIILRLSTDGDLARLKREISKMKKGGKLDLDGSRNSTVITKQQKTSPLAEDQISKVSQIDSSSEQAGPQLASSAADQQRGLDLLSALSFSNPSTPSRQKSISDVATSPISTDGMSSIGNQKNRSEQVNDREDYVSSTNENDDNPQREAGRKTATRCASSTGVGLGFHSRSMHTPGREPGLSNKSANRGEESTKASFETTNYSKRKKMQEKQQPLMTRRASFSELQLSKKMNPLIAGDDEDNSRRPMTSDPKFRLVMLRHAAMCSIAQKGGVCPSDPKCSQMKELLRHMTLCKHQSTTVPCPFPDCHESKSILLVMHKASQILARQAEYEKNLPKVVQISKPREKFEAGPKSGTGNDGEEGDFAGDNDDDISDIASFGSAGQLVDDSSRGKSSPMKGSMPDTSAHEHRRVLQLEQKSSREKMQRRPSWNGSIELKAQRSIGDKALREKIAKEEAERKKARADLRKRHEAVKARIAAKIQNANAEKEMEEFQSLKHERERKLASEKQNQLEFQCLQMQKASSAGVQQNKLPQDLEVAKVRAAATSDALKRDRERLQRDQEMLKAEEELRQKQMKVEEEWRQKREQLEAWVENSNQGKRESATATKSSTNDATRDIMDKKLKKKPLKQKVVQRKSLPSNGGRIIPTNPQRIPSASAVAFSNKVSATRELVEEIDAKRRTRKLKGLEADKRRREQEAAIYKAREERLERLEKEETKREAAQAAAFDKEAERFSTNQLSVLSDKVYSERQHALSDKLEFEKLKAAKLAKKLKKEKGRASTAE